MLIAYIRFDGATGNITSNFSSLKSIKNVQVTRFSTGFYKVHFSTNRNLDELQDLVVNLQTYNSTGDVIAVVTSDSKTFDPSRISWNYDVDIHIKTSKISSGSVTLFDVSSISVSVYGDNQDLEVDVNSDEVDPFAPGRDIESALNTLLPK